MNSLGTSLMLITSLATVGISCKPKAANPPTESKEEKKDGNKIKEVEFRPERQFKSSEGKQLIKDFKEIQPQLENATDRLVLLAECGYPEGKGPVRIERVKDSNSWPDDRLVMYVFLLNAEGRIRLMQIVPNSESGDWYEQNDFLFESSGTLRYWEHYFGTFDPDGPTKSWYAYAWNQTGGIIETARLLVDSEGKPWKGAAPKAPELPPTKLKAILNQHKLVPALTAAKVRLPETD